ncbi:MAG: hypothetical protein FJZ87_12865 [Chloroflexi bacterium]|nr:hypothetical protein [Chloroflexota bacterium]
MLWSNAELRALAAAKAEMVVQQEGAEASIEDLIKELGELTIKIGWWQEVRPAANATTEEWAWFIGMKALGLMLTAAAVSQGSSFWYDLLKKITTPVKGVGAGSGLPAAESGEAKG